MSLNQRIKKSQNGFTIVELMIATTVMSVILLLATGVFTHLGSDYAKGIQMVRTQNSARNILDQLSQQLQFSSDPFTSGSSGAYRALCIGTTRYSYIVNKQEGTASNQSVHVLWQDTMPLGSPCLPLNVSVSPPSTSTGAAAGNPGTGKELVPDHMRLTGFCAVDGGNNEFNANIWLVYGDDDLLGPSSGSDGCGGTHRYCLGGAGEQFCALSELQTTVARRIY